MMRCTNSHAMHATSSPVLQLLTVYQYEPESNQIELQHLMLHVQLIVYPLLLHAVTLPHCDCLIFQRFKVNCKIPKQQGEKKETFLLAMQWKHIHNTQEGLLVTQ